MAEAAETAAAEAATMAMVAGETPRNPLRKCADRNKHYAKIILFSYCSTIPNFNPRVINVAVENF
jgi:hypothetical protein